MKLENDLIKKINKLLIDLSNDDIWTDNKDNSELGKKTITYCKALNLIRLSPKGTRYELSENGIFAIQDGGIKEYLLNIGIDKNLDKIIKRLTFKKMKYENLTHLIFLITGAIIPLIFTGILRSHNNSIIQEKLDKLVVEKNDSIIHYQTLLNEQNTLILSLKK